MNIDKDHKYLVMRETRKIDHQTTKKNVPRSLLKEKCRYYEPILIVTSKGHCAVEKLKRGVITLLTKLY